VVVAEELGELDATGAIAVSVIARSPWADSRVSAKTWIASAWLAITDPTPVD